MTRQNKKVKKRINSVGQPLTIVSHVHFQESPVQAASFVGIINGLVLFEVACRVTIGEENTSISTGLDFRGSETTGLDTIGCALTVQEPDPHIADCGRRLVEDRQLDVRVLETSEAGHENSEGESRPRDNEHEPPHRKSHTKSLDGPTLPESRLASLVSERGFAPRFRRKSSLNASHLVDTMKPVKPEGQTMKPGEPHGRGIDGLDWQP